MAVLGLGVAVMLSCGDADPTSIADLDLALRPPSTVARTLWPKLVADADARVLSPALREAALHADPAVRASATRLIGRLEIEAALPLLELALADIEPGIRLDAARGIARHPGLSVAEREQLLLGAFTAEPALADSKGKVPTAWSNAGRAGMLELLADVWPNASSPALPLALQTPEDAAGACRALGRLAQRGHVPSPETLGVALDRVLQPSVLGPDTLDCALALRQPALAPLLSRDRADLAAELATLVSRQPVLAPPLLELIAQLPAADSLGAIEPLLGGSSPTALRAFARQASLPKLLALASQGLERDSAPAADALANQRLHVLLALFAALEPHVQQPEVGELAERAVVRLGGAAQEPPRHASGRALAHCAAARLADLARRWPKHILSCGAGIAPDSVRDTWIAEVIAGATDSPEVRAAHLRRILGKPALAARAAAIAATASLPPEHATPLLILALESAEPAALAAALRALPRRAPELRERPELRAGLIAAGERAEAAPEAALAFVQAAQTLLRPAPGSAPEPTLRARITRLAEHPALGIREPARALLDEWQQPVPTTHRAVEAPIQASKVPAADALFHVKLSTSAGTELELELEPRHAPAAVRAFIQLIEDEALDDLPIDTLVAGRVIGFRPPARAGFALRHEDFDGPVEEGSVVLQDHGRDVVGPGFAIILSRTPELDRRVTRIGRVRSGNPHALHLGDRIERAELTGGAAR